MNESKATAASRTDPLSQQPDGVPAGKTHGETNGETASKNNEESHGEPMKPILRVLVANEQSILEIDHSQLQAAVASVFRESLYDSGMISIAVVDDPTIHEVNRQYLEHDYPTDVLSFVLEDRQPFLEGELVVSTDTAVRNAVEYGWPARSELLLYVIHGALHLVGYRDKQADEIAAMRAAEAGHLRELGIKLPNGSSRWSDSIRSTEPVTKSVGESQSS